jgi:DNA-binding CsgD family transcriptional regulator
VIDRYFYNNEIVENALRKVTTVPYDEFRAKLTNREMEILLLICQEYTPNEISNRLQISDKTFFSHRANLLGKANVRSNVGLLRFALQRGYFGLG